MLQAKGSGLCHHEAKLTDVDALFFYNYHTWKWVGYKQINKQINIDALWAIFLNVAAFLLVPYWCSNIAVILVHICLGIGLLPDAATKYLKQC